MSPGETAAALVCRWHIELGERKVLEQARDAHIEQGNTQPCRLPAGGGRLIAGAGLVQRKSFTLTK
jgi:hypothetical protein